MSRLGAIAITALLWQYDTLEEVDKLRDVAQLGSALRSGRRGRGFESRHPDSSKAYCGITL